MSIKSIVGLIGGLTVGVLLLSSSSCKKEEKCEYPNLTMADIKGNVLLFDDAKEGLDKSGMAVTIYESNGITPAFTDTSDSKGNYRLKDVPFGVYSLYFQKEGYGTLLFGVDNKNDCKLETEVAQLYLGQKSTTNITALSAQTVAAHVEFELTIYPEASTENPRYVRLFFSNSNDISNVSYTFQSGLLQVESNSLSFSLSSGELHGFGFISGETIYVKAYGDSFYSNEYFDVFLERSIFPNTNIVTPPDVDFIAP